MKLNKLDVLAEWTKIVMAFNGYKKLGYKADINKEFPQLTGLMKKILKGEVKV